MRERKKKTEVEEVGSRDRRRGKRDLDVPGESFRV